VSGATPSPVAEAYGALRSLNASWNADVGRPSEPGWIAGSDLLTASEGPFNELLARIGQRAGTSDRRTIAASFALRFGWAAGMAIAPYLHHRCVPDVALENVSFKFKPSTFLERTAVHEPRGTMVAADAHEAPPTIATVPDVGALIDELRRQLVAQATPVVDALFAWSGFARRGTWGQLTSSWASHVTTLCENRLDHRPVRPLLEALFDGDDDVARMQPRLHEVRYRDAVHFFQRRASCCRYYLLPAGQLCASCPLVSDATRIGKNQAWMKTQFDRQGPGPGHG
jgi:ferric iron reductase protein FhuF